MMEPTSSSVGRSRDAIHDAGLTSATHETKRPPVTSSMMPDARFSMRPRSTPCGRPPWHACPVAGDDDWRLQGQERYLTEIVLRWRTWSSPRADWDHDHCEFCWCHFGDHVFDDDPDTQLAGYASEDGKHWICR